MARQLLSVLGLNAVEQAKKIKESKYQEIVSGFEPIRADVIFTAGAPGAGKSEFIKAIKVKTRRNLVLDPDEYRTFFDGYNGKNSSEYNCATTVLLSHFIDKSMNDRYHLIIDTNFISFDSARKNLKKAMSNNYRIHIAYIYTDPKIAWEFVKARTRYIEPAVFKRNITLCRETIRLIMDEREFKDRINLNAFITMPKNNFSTGQVIEHIRNGKPPYPITQSHIRKTTIKDIEALAPISYTPLEMDEFVVY